VATVIPDSEAFSLRIGGPLGSHARIKGKWFDPVPVVMGSALVTWLLLMAKQVPCIQTDPATPPNSFAGLCYTDVSVLYLNREPIWSGGSVFFTPDQPMEYPPLTAVFITVARWIAARLGAQVGPNVEWQDRVDASNIFFGVTAALLFICFLTVVVVHLELGRSVAAAHTQGVRVRAWDAIFVAACPVVIFTGLINWDLFAVALTALTLLLWARRHPLAAGIALGLAVSAKFYTLALIPALFLLCLRASKTRAFLGFVTTAAASWAVINVPVMLIDFHAWSYFWTFNADRGADLGSIWYMMLLAGLDLSSARVVSILMVIGIAVGGLVIIAQVLDAPRRPRVAQVLLLVMVVFLVCNKVYSPQYVLWLFPIAVLARPKLLDLGLLTISEVLYTASVWAFLDGVFGIGTGADRLYWAAIILRCGMQLWFASRVLSDIQNPWDDPVRVPFVDDPLGGVLDHEPDASWIRPSGTSVMSHPINMLVSWMNQTPVPVAVPVGETRVTSEVNVELVDASDK
jgi:hypothetical protein